ncbi:MULTISPECIES: tRNA (adenosine(37)-N6)-threonylcarbamoyltransferase complex ATPase subunit type 1 TsaE [Thermus]|jgi:tRNA threonylcarbamoyladenosine biosynthesis protein TsaE|uniref:tRNA threonylcarbamoyladenosine biosynthesis protein TsaE n=1 Tax=Thermus brockianus TaxID=56956 RepID=A0A1J0LTC1_THEBO|nr:tRNA (adenosine(37)-N6)-threonylcarbamoyltransferase complex ATPase subunit type 1 TsaE [Thermus brockianus]APD09472.1 tRNA threonylcarbamoyladenosine biosynthesis protein TsaE [Thermus brockianus]BDG17248.1 tRNA (adenosine(37)-N6)-threonylcarbamoyltransferase complex ATPase subunit type 1 TsaE [Thermus brockianus]
MRKTLLLTRTLGSLEDTQALAKEVLPLLPQGALVVLEGPLGAGKTTFARFLAEAMGFGGRVTSPTYTLIHTYPTPQGPLVHADLYRLKDSHLLLPQLEAAREGARLLLVEWGDPEGLEADFLLRLIPQGEVRQAELWHLHPGEEEGV